MLFSYHGGGARFRVGRRRLNRVGASNGYRVDAIRVSIAVAVVLRPSVAGSPHIDRAQASSSVLDAIDESPLRQFTRALHCDAVIERPPRAAVDVDVLRVVA